MLIYQESNFYDCLAVLYFDLVIFGTAVLLVYEDYDNVCWFYNPCFGEYYVDLDGRYRPLVFYREFTMTVAAVVDEFGYDNTSSAVRGLFDRAQQTGVQGSGSGLTREIIVAHCVEPNDDGKGPEFGFNSNFAFREGYFEWGGSQSPQGGSAAPQGWLRKSGFHESPAIVVRWDLVSNDAYGRSPGMDALPDAKQLQMEVRRKAQGIDKHVNPPMVADIQLKNQPASLLPGGVTYLAGMLQNGGKGFAPAYGDWKPDLSAMIEDLQEVRDRIKRTFFNDIFQTASQFETRSNVTAVEWDMRRSESMVMLGPVLERINHEGLKPIIERTFAIAARAGILPPAPPEIQGKNIDIEFVSMLATAQAAAATSGIERLLSIAGNLVGVDPAILDNIDLDFALAKYSSLMNNDPRIIRSPAALAAIRQRREQQQQQTQQAEMAEKMAAAGQTLSQTEVGGGQNALQKMLGG